MNKYALLLAPLLSVFWYRCLVVVQSNTVLPNDWVPLEYGECTGPEIAEGVWYPGDGHTCNFHHSESLMPAEYQNGYVLAASQDLYNGFHTVDYFNTDCELNLQSEDQTEDICGYTCGVCFMVSGPNGAATFIVQEIADIGAVEDNGRGLNFHLGSDHHDDIRPGRGAVNDIEYRRVPCTVTGGIYFWFQSWGSGYNVYFTPINYRIGITSIYARHGTGANDTKWYRMPRDWTNRYWYKGWNSDDDSTWQPYHTPIWGDSADGTFDLKLVSHLDEEVICYDMSLPDSPDSNQENLHCLDASGSAVQFSDPNRDTDSCRANVTVRLTVSYDSATYDAFSYAGEAAQTELRLLYGSGNTDGWIVRSSRILYNNDESVAINTDSAKIAIIVVYDSNATQSWSETIADDIVNQALIDASDIQVAFDAVGLSLTNASSDNAGGDGGGGDGSGVLRLWPCVFSLLTGLSALVVVLL